ncbi:hypothetical protein LOTGIDRAFT_158379, partial [Lottia gigantea]
TGTKAGDPVEVKALGTFFQTDENSTPKIIGSVKTNIGHLESAAGVAGLIKVILMHYHHQIVPSLHFERPSPEVPLEEFKFTVPVKSNQWPETERDFLRSSVNSFSFGGSNCHAIVTTPKNRCMRLFSGHDIPKVICISAIEPPALQRIKDAMCENAKDLQLADLSYTSIYRRDHYPCRLAVAGQNTAEVLQILEGTDVDKHVMVKYQPAKGKKYIFVFAGLGTNWQGMCQEMLKRFKVFRSTIEDISKYLERYANWNLMENLQNGFDLEDANIAPIMTFACEVALFVLVESFGINPDAIIGQSIGEVAAAFASGTVTLEQAVYIIYHRTRVQVQGTGGKMFVAKNIEIDKVEEILEKYESEANVSVYSSPMSCTISCDEDVVDKLKEDIKEVNTGCMFIDLNVTSAFHSHHMSKSADEMKSCAEIIGEEPKIDVFSTVSGVKAEEGDFITPQYWADNIRKPVKLYQAVLEAHDPTKYNIFVELGPRPILRAHLPSIFPDQVLFDSIPLMNVNDEINCITKTMASFYNYGKHLKWDNFDNTKANTVEYPKYKFNRIYNMYVPTPTQDRLNGVSSILKQHPMVKSKGTEKNVVKVVLDPTKIGSIYEHRVNGYVMVPGATYAEVGLGISALKSSTVSFREVTVAFRNPIIIFNRETRDLEAKLDITDDRTDFTVVEGNNVYCTGSIVLTFNQTYPVLNVEEIRSRCDISLPGKQIYSDLSMFGFSYGKAMTILQGAVKNEFEALIELKLNDLLKQEMDGTILHPAIIDSMLQSTIAIGSSNDDGTQVIPVNIEKLRVHGELKDDMLVYVQRSPSSTEVNIRFKLILCSLSGQPIASIESFTAKVIGQNDKLPQQIYFEQNWKLMPQSKQIEELMSEKFVTVSVKQRPSRDEEVNVVVPLTDNNKDIEKLRETLNEYRYVAIIINSDFDENYGGIEIQRAVTDYLLWLKVVVECINEVNEKHDIIRLLIAFYNTWTIDEMNTKSTIMIPDNIIHSSLWGGARSIQRELGTLATHLVDLRELEGTSDSEQLLIVFDKLASDWLHNGELLFTTEGVFGYQLRYMEESGSKIYPSITDTGDADFDLFSTSETEVKGVFKLYTRNTSLHEQPGSVLLNVTKLVFQDSSLFLPVFIADQEKANDDGWPVYCIETIGYRSMKPNELLVSCFPVPASNKVVVPTSCCMPLSSIPFYKPGLLSTLVSLWTLASSLKAREVIIIQPYKFSIHGILLGFCFAVQRTKFKAMTPQDFSKATKLEGKKVVCLSFVDQALVDDLMSKDSIKSFVSFSSLLPVNTATVLRTSAHRIDIKRINEHDMFSQPIIRKAIRGVTRVIKRWGKTIKNVLEQLTDEPNLQDPLQKLFAMTDIDLQEKSGFEVPIRLTPNRLLSKTSAYIVVGGLTGLGWQCVHWLATHQAGYVLIFNRRTPNEEDAASIEELSSSTSCTIECYSVDVVNLSSVTGAIRTFNKTYPDVPIKGVLHGAGVTRDSSLFKMTEEQMTECFNPKISGAWNLHQATMYMNLDFFILHSSITAILGTPGQSNYGVGNAFQDSLISVRKKMGLPVQSLNWGPLDMGMLEKGTEQDRARMMLLGMGFTFIGKNEIGDILEKIILSKRHQVVITEFDLEKLRDCLIAFNDYNTITKLNTILPKASFDPASVESDFAQLLKDCDPKDMLNVIESELTKLVSKILSVPEMLLSSDTRLIDAGLDSMFAMTLVNQIRKDINVKIPLNLLFDPDTSILFLSKFIEKEYCEGDTVSRTEEEDDPEDNFASFSEHKYLKAYNTDLYKALHLANEMYLGNIHNFINSTDQIKELIKKVLIRNPGATTIYDWPEGNTKPERTDITKSYLEIEKAVNIVEVAPDDPEIEKIFNKRKLDRFDLRSEGPVRFTWAMYETHMRLAMVFTHVSFDMMGVNLFLADFTSCLRRLCMTQSLNNLPQQMFLESPTPSNKILLNLLEAESEKLHDFWKGQFEKGVPMITTDLNKKYQPVDGTCSTAGNEFPQDLQEKCDTITKELGTTPFKLYITLYQLLLSIRSKSQRVMVNTVVDLRQFSAELLSKIECLVNPVPIFSEIPEPNTSFINFFKNNSETITHGLNNGLYPYDEMYKFASEEDKQNLNAHYVIANDYTMLKELDRQNKKGGMDLKISEEHDHSAYQSTLRVSTDKKTNTTYFKIFIGGSQSDNQDAEELLQDFTSMLEIVITNPDVSIHELREKFKPTLLGHFKKETWKGLDNVVAKFEKDPNNDLIVLIGKSVLKRKDIKEIYSAGNKQLQVLVIKSSKKQHRLIYDSEDKKMLRLMDKLQNFV